MNPQNYRFFLQNTMHKLLLGIAVFLHTWTAFAQNEACQGALDKAKAAYNSGKVKEVKQILKDECIKLLPRKENIKEAYYLLCTASLFLNEKEEATTYMLKLLKMEPEYAVEPTMPVEFIQFYNSFKVTPLLMIGLRVGANMSFADPLKSFSVYNLLPDSKFGSYTAKYGFQLGIVAQRPLTKHLDIGIEPSFRMSKYQYSNTIIEYVNVTFTESQTYLEMPIYLKWNFKNKFNFMRDRRSFKNKIFPYITAGATLSMLNKSSGIALRLDGGAEGSTPLTLESVPYDMKPARHTQKIMPMGALGVEYKSGRSTLALEVRYMRMLGTQVKPAQRYANQELLLKYGYTDNDFRIHNASITLAFMYPLYKARPASQKTFAKPRILNVEHDKDKK